ncbi:unnamed protein product [Haemonchus placei]|uniref:Uncharacterized protein n=1 Tax=Haemonchus placei TaxID=6290 RepID=A0A0N4WUD6_HAEPC|nr:unnamed protein product [Haemonchus placei]
MCSVDRSSAVATMLLRLDFHILKRLVVNWGCVRSRDLKIGRNWNR